MEKVWINSVIYIDESGKRKFINVNKVYPSMVFKGMEQKKLRRIYQMAKTSICVVKKLKLNDYYEVILSDNSTQICKFIQIIDDLPIFKTINNRFLYYDGGKNEFNNRYMGWKSVKDQTQYKREDILSNLIEE
jgi:hypothetical protein